MDVYFVRLPMWVPLAMSAVLPIGWLARVLLGRRRRKRRLRQGRCAHCGYDLRAHAVGQPCPECGTPKLKPTKPRKEPVPRPA